MMTGTHRRRLAGSIATISRLRVVRVALPLIAFLPLAGGVHAQVENGTDHSLNIWIVRPATAADRAVRRAQNDLHDITVYRETTAGSFGRSASDVGQTAGSYGRPASDVGTSASNVGQTAGSYGQAASSLSGNVPSQTAGSYGKTAGSFGMSASDFHGAPVTTEQVDDTTSRDGKGSAWTHFLAVFRSRFPSMDLHVAEVNSLDLRTRLQAAARTSLYPDVLLADRMPEWWPQVERSLVIQRVGPREKAETRTRSLIWPGARRGVPYTLIYGTAGAPHPEDARAVLLWLASDEEDHAPAAPAPMPPAGLVASQAVLQLLRGESVDAFVDESVARFNVDQARAQALGRSVAEIPHDLQVTVQVNSVDANQRLAAVSLTASCVAREAVGKVYPLVLLRADDHGRWRVLQISLGPTPDEIAAMLTILTPFVTENRPGQAIGTPALSFPGDLTHAAAGTGLRLAWENNGDDGLLLLEWQPVGPGGPASSVELMDDRQARGRSELLAPFGELQGPVRWRVWAVRRGGEVRISDWRTVLMDP